MLDALIVTVWMGGFYTAFIVERAGGASKRMALLDAILWPLGVGRYIAMRFYVTENWRCGVTVKFTKDTTT